MSHNLRFGAPGFHLVLNDIDDPNDNDDDEDDDLSLVPVKSEETDYTC